MISGIKHVFLFLKGGGILMLFLGIASIIAMTIVIERLWVFKNLTEYITNLSMRIKRLVSKGSYKEALKFCEDNPGPLAVLFNEIIIYKYLPLTELKERIQDRGRSITPNILKNISVLGTIANITPLIGLLGTVTGMIRAFFSISEGGVGNPDLLASGIAEALITTATGLAIGIPAVIIYNFMVGYSKEILLSLEMNSIELIDIIKFSSLSDPGTVTPNGKGLDNGTDIEIETEVEDDDADTITETVDVAPRTKGLEIKPDDEE